MVNGGSTFSSEITIRGSRAQSLDTFFNFAHWTNLGTCLELGLGSQLSEDELNRGEHTQENHRLAAKRG
jgi:hypothetical protein